VPEKAVPMEIEKPTPFGVWVTLGMPEMTAPMEIEKPSPLEVLNHLRVQGVWAMLWTH
jgi:hypothetical protein